MLQRRDRLGPDYFTDGECCKGTSGWTLCQPEPQRRQRRSIRPGPASRHQHSTRYARGRRRLRPDLHGRVEPHAPADEPGGTGRVGTASGSRSLAAPTGRAPAPSVDAHRPRGLARPPPAVCCRAAGSQAAGKLPVATTLSSLDAAVVTRRRHRVTSFAFPSGGAPSGASLHLRLPLRRRRPRHERRQRAHFADVAGAGSAHGGQPGERPRSARRPQSATNLPTPGGVGVANCATYPTYRQPTVVLSRVRGTPGVLWVPGSSSRVRVTCVPGSWAAWCLCTYLHPY